MSTQLIPIGENRIGGERIQTINARDLHTFLESKQEFTAWIKNRIRQYGFAEGTDYLVFDNSIKNPEGGRPVIDYHVTLDMAKELCMVERNERGREARQYFIRCEKELKEIGAKAASTITLPTGKYIALLEKQVALLERSRRIRPRGTAPRPVTEEERSEIQRLKAEGHSFREIGRRMQRNETTIRRVLSWKGGAA